MEKNMRYKFVLWILIALGLGGCKDYLSPVSPSKVGDEFVTTTPGETFKTLSWCYANYRENAIMGVYRYNDPIGSDAEMYPEEGSSNNLNAMLRPQLLSVNAVAGGFNALYATLARAAKVAQLISEKKEFQDDWQSGTVSDWTQLYGEATTMWAFCYFNLVKHFGDVPMGYENKSIEDYTLTSRFEIYDSIINALEKVEPFMYELGQGGITAERFSKTFCDALIGETALYAAGYQTIRTDVPGLYGNLEFEKISSEKFNSVYARRKDYLDYDQTAATYLQKAIDHKGSSHLITSDDRSYADNPFQLNFQYFANLQVSPESIFEVGNIQGGLKGQTTSSEYGYAFARPSDGGSSNSAPNKAFGSLRIIPSVYYGDFENNDKRRDASVAVTGSDGHGNEIMLSFVPGNKSTGGISTNKWDENRMNPPFTTSQRNSGMNWPVLRMGDVILMLAQADAELGKSSDAINLVNQIRERAFGNNGHNIAGLSGDALKEAILEERKLELLGEGTRRWDLIRAGKLSERAVGIQQEMQEMVNDLSSQGFHKFKNSNEISNYIWVKKVQLSSPLTYDCTDTADAALYPAWRGQYDYSSLPDVSGKVEGTDHNLAIKGLFTYIDPNSATASSLESQGYVKTNWGIDIVKNFSSYQRNMLSGVTSPDDPPIYYWPIPSETISGSKGMVTNGYGLAQQ